jgi:nucleoside-diphosphate-sugar epimerase
MPNELADMKTVLVTGAAGFVGNALLQRIAGRENQRAVGIVRSAMESATVSIEYVEADVAESGWTQLLPAADVVVHLAQSRHYRNFPEGSADMFRVNVQSTAELLEWARLSGVQKFIFASTGNVYASAASPRVESDSCDATSMYAATKLAAEMVARQYASLFDVIILRIFGVYGPGQRDMMIPDMIARVRKGDEVTLAGGTGPLLTPIFIDDCIDMILGFIDAPGNEAKGTFNVAGSEMVSLREIVQTIEAQIGKTARVRNADGEPVCLAGVNDEICRVLQLWPCISLRDGLKATISEIRKDGL